MVYVHTNLHLIYRKRNEWLNGKTRIWDVFPNDMGLCIIVDLELANFDLNEAVLEPVTFDDGDTVEGSSSTPADAEMTLDTKEEDAAKESSGEHDDRDEDSDVDYDDEE